MSKKHHYIPKFLLKRWAGNGGRVIRWKRADYTREVWKALKYPEQFGYVIDLYRLLNVGDEIALLIENGILGSEIESQSNLILEALINNRCAALTRLERTYWTLFLNAFRFRHPNQVKELADAVALRIDEVCHEGQEELERTNSNARRPTWQETFELVNPAYLPNLPKKLLVDLIVSPRLCLHLFDMGWAVLNLENAENQLLLGDRPFVELKQSNDFPSFKFLPLSPTKLFVAADARDLQMVSRQSPNQIVRIANLETVRRAAEFVCGDAKRSFLDKHLIEGVRLKRGVDCCMSSR